MSTKGRGWVKIFEPNTIYLSPKRGLPPNHTDPDYPYMMGENHAEVGTVSPQAFVLAHEMAHVLAPKLKPELGRPALGLMAGTQEIEAEIIGLVLMEIAFGSTADEFGFPDMVEYKSPNVRDKPVNRLRWQYCKIIKASFRLQTFRCNRTNQFDLE